MPLLNYLEPGEAFPPSSEALSYPNGLLAAGGSLDSHTLLAAYRRGIFPWYEAPQPLLWWAPDPRSVLFVDELHISRSLRKTLRRGKFTLRVDHGFRDVMQACAAPRDAQLGTWIDPAMIDAYSALNAQGLAHSIEAWQDDALVGGLYGVCIGGVFFGESMFSLTDNASKVALVTLVWLLKRRGAVFIDCQIESEHLNSLGARNISRVDFENRLQQTIAMTPEQDTWTPPANCGELI
ncbi:leucyl/phenylalanyl-tRNA--protein transferase [Congregibacter variabilis]|uniref:Leucyl/phenylalanyl-tRNA--protein transferase n=1 Tax=Congregibacter variabilis TaxID=3081200 RepID=A0ABZ0I3I4_9GAMM|nr:leucyl/phenylalanyl-tRNA--protein transferase [Congregibacter sp. IMCC43200]